MRRLTAARSTVASSASRTPRVSPVRSPPMNAAVEISALLGTQSVRTQAPPSPSRSTTVTRAPARAATSAASYPPGPPPRTTTDGCWRLTPPSNHRRTPRPGPTRIGFGPLGSGHDRSRPGRIRFVSRPGTRVAGREHPRGPRPRRPRHRPVRGRRAGRRRHRRAHGRRAARRRPRPRVRLGPDGRPHRRDPGHRPTGRSVPGFSRAAVAGHSGDHALGRHRRHREARARLRHPHPLLRGPRRARRRPRRAHGAAPPAARPSCSPTAAAGSTRRGAPAHRSSSATTSTSRRPRRIEGANFVDLTDLYSRGCAPSRTRSTPTLDEGVYVQFRGPHYETPAEVQMAKHPRRRPRRHVDDARGDRRPAASGWRCSASRS